MNLPLRLLPLVAAGVVALHAQPPAAMLFFPHEGTIRSAVLETEGRALIDELAQFEPCTVAEWAGVSSTADRDELVETVRDLAQMGLISFG